MPKLSDIQLNFQVFLTGADSSIASLIAADNEADTVERLNIYATAYRSRLIEILMKDFPALHHILGDAQFIEMASIYINNFPSQFRSARWFGQHLFAFLKQHESYAELPFLSELAQFEWLLTETFDAEDTSVLSLAALSLIPAEQWPEMKISLIKALRLMPVNWNTLACWQTQQHEHNDYQPAMVPSAQTLLIWRKDYQIHFRTLTAAENCALHCILQQQNFSFLCEQLCQFMAPATVPLYAASLIKTWVIEGLVAAV